MLSMDSQYPIEYVQYVLWANDATNQYHCNHTVEIEWAFLCYTD
jgi:hypothetical protein